MLRVCLALDDASILSSQTEEYWTCQDCVLQELGPFTAEHIDPTQLTQAKSADLYVIDFGGLAVSYSNTALNRALHSLRRMIEDHPSSVFLLYSTHTEREYRAMMAELLDNDDDFDDGITPAVQQRLRLPSNVVLWHDHSWDQVRAWLGLDKPDETTEEFIEQRRVLDGQCPYVNQPRLYQAIPDAVSPQGAATTDLDNSEEFVRQKPAKIDWPVVGHITLPVYATAVNLPDGSQQRWAMWRLSDDTVTVTQETGANETELGRLGGTFFGHYTVTIKDEQSDDITYRLDPRAIWAAMTEFHEQHKRMHPQKAEHDK